jgi:hypothetical protein
MIAERHGLRIDPDVDRRLLPKARHRAPFPIWLDPADDFGPTGDVDVLIDLPPGGTPSLLTWRHAGRVDQPAGARSGDLKTPGFLFAADSSARAGRTSDAICRVNAGLTHWRPLAPGHMVARPETRLASRRRTRADLDRDRNAAACVVNCVQDLGEAAFARQRRRPSGRRAALAGRSSACATSWCMPTKHRCGRHLRAVKTSLSALVGELEAALRSWDKEDQQSAPGASEGRDPV